MIGTPMTDRELAQEALSRMPEEQKLALANEIVLSAVDPSSRIQLMRIARGAKMALNDIERDESIARESA